MSGKTFCDANLLIYAHDVDAGAKHDIAKAALTELWNERSGVVSPQVLQEFYVNVTRKTGTPLPNSAARAIVRSYEIWCVEVGTSEVLSAFRIEDEAQIGFWDAMIVAAAVKGGAKRILSEDLNAGKVISGVRVENPFEG